MKEQSTGNGGYLELVVGWWGGEEYYRIVREKSYFEMKHGMPMSMEEGCALEDWGNVFEEVMSIIGTQECSDSVGKKISPTLKLNYRAQVCQYPGGGGARGMEMKTNTFAVPS